MQLSELAQLLRQISDRGGGFGSTSEKALRKLADILSLRETDDLDSLEKLLKPKVARTKKTAAVNFTKVDEYIERLANATPTEAREICDKLASDKAVKKAEMVALAQKFAGTNTAYKTKLSAHAAIVDLVRREAWDRGAVDAIKSRAGRS